MAAIEWKSGVSGNWDTATDWSGGVVPGAGDDVTIDAPGAFAVTISSADAAHSLTLDNATATIVDTGTLSVGSTLVLTAGTFDLDSGGEIRGGTLSASGGAFEFNGGTLDDVTFDGVLSVTGALGLQVMGNLTVRSAGGDGDGVVDVAGGVLLFDNPQTFDNATVNLSDGLISSENRLTLGVDLTINQIGKQAGIASQGAVVNEGTINASYNGGLFSIGYANVGAFTNAGSITVSNGDTLAISGDWSNKGTITATDATVAVRGTFTYAALGNFVLTNSALVIGGGEGDERTLLNNTGATLNVGLGTKLGIITLAGYGTISGGTVAETGSGVVFGGYETNTLVGVTFDGALNLDRANARLQVYGLTAKGEGGVGNGIVNLTGNRSELFFENSQTFDNATIKIGNKSGSAVIEEQDTNGRNSTLTLGVDLTIDQTGKFATITSGRFASDTVVNQGTIDAAYKGGLFDVGFSVYNGVFTNAGLIAVSNGDTLALGGSWTNVGTITATGATVDLDGTFTYSALGNFVQTNSSVSIGGTLNNAGMTLNVGTGTKLGNVTLASQGIVYGGTVAEMGSGMVFNGGALNGVTVDGPLNLTGADASVRVVGYYGLVLRGAGGDGDGVINLTGNDSQIVFQNADASHNTDINNATIYIGSAAGGAVIDNEQLNADGGTLTLGANLVIDQVGKFATIASGGSYAYTVLTGTINASYAGGSFDISAQRFTNDGIIDISNGDEVIFGGSLSTRALGKVDVGSGGALLDFAGTLLNGGATLAVAAGEALAGAIYGGTITGTIITGGLTLEAATVQGAIDLSGAAARLTILDGLIMTGAGGTGAGGIDLTGNESQIVFRGAETINNATIDIGADGGDFASIAERETKDRPATLTLGVNLEIDQTGERARLTGAPEAGDAIVNAGTIDAAYKGGFFEIDPQTFTNTGTIDVSNGDKLTIDAVTWSNIGTIKAMNATVDLDGSFILGTFVDINSIVSIVGMLDNAGATLRVGAGTVLTLAGTVSGGTIAESSSAVVRGHGVIDAHVLDAGVVEAASGTLELGQLVNGGGDLRIGEGATLQVDAVAAATLTANFSGADGVLALGAPARFKATIAGFASGDTIDLLRKAATGATLEAGDKLVVTNGTTTVATLQLSGDYAGDSFAVAGDGQGGTDVTLVTPMLPAAPFVQAMAGLGAPSAGQAVEGADTTRRQYAVSLAGPRVAIA